MATKSAKRDAYKTRSILVSGEQAKETIRLVISNLPIDAVKPVEIVIREQIKVRKLDQNQEMWAGPLKDISEQAYLQGRTFSAAIWHEFFKSEYLPDDMKVDYEELVTLVKNHETYKKYDFKPDGERVLIGSTTELSIKGFAQYREQICAYGASLGVQFRMSPREAARYG